MKAEQLADWISLSSVVVDHHRIKDKEIYREVYLAVKDNQQLILTCKRANHQLPIFYIVWIDNGVSTLLYQDILSEGSGQIKHSVGELEGEHSIRENVETIFSSLYKKVQL